MNFIRQLIYCWCLAIVFGLCAGCSTPSASDTRKHEKWLEYASYSPEIRGLIEQSIIRQGMTMDAVYIAFGVADQEFGSSRTGQARWCYGEYMGGGKPKFYFRQIEDRGVLYLQKCPKNVKEKPIYSRVEIVFLNGKVSYWELMGKIE